MKYKLKSHKKDGDRLILTITELDLFGLIRNDIECIDSTQMYSYNGQCVWYQLPKVKKVKFKSGVLDFKLQTKSKIKRIEGGSNLLEFCIECKNDINIKNKLLT